MPAGDMDILEEPLPLPARSAPWPLLNRLPQLLAEADGSPTAYRDCLRQAHDELKARFLAEEPIEDLVHARAALIDVVLREAWRSQHLSDDDSWSLVAVGGYGRGELHPCSDIDIMLLVPAPPDEQGRSSVERLVTFFWDIGLEVGHSVRTVEECVQESIADVSVMTTLLEARHLAGSAALVAQMRDALSPDHIWPVKDFFEAKVREQAERHLKANDTA
jgi:[protein-PII] uridylyltransferase